MADGAAGGGDGGPGAADAPKTGGTPDGGGAQGGENPPNSTSEPEGPKEPGEPEESSILSGIGKDKAPEEGEPKKPGEEGKEDSKDKKDGEPEGLTREALAVPEGKEWDPGLGDPFLGILNDRSLSDKDRAQKLIDLYSSAQDKFLQSMAESEAAINKHLAEVSREWEAAARKDPEYGGDKWEASAGVIAAGRDRLATPGAVEVIEAHKLGSNPEILRMFYRAGRLLSEDGSGRSGGSGGDAGSGDKWADMGKRMFGKSLEGLNIRGSDG
jgi:hypothetical protein